MIGQPTVTGKPSRSDEIIDPNHQLRISQQVRSHFDSILPKRHPKPDRSDPDYHSPATLPDQPFATIPELYKFQSLVSQSQGIVPVCNSTTVDEFVETGYYKELVSIDKEHHTTGSGFIKATTEKGGDRGLYDLRLQVGNGGYNIKKGDMICKSNPATNDWVPSNADYYNQAE